MTYKKLLSTIESNLKAKRDRTKLSALFSMGFVTLAFVFALTGTYEYTKPYDTNIKLVKDNSEMFVIEAKKTEIVSGISNADMADFNENPTPEKIKSYMQSIAPKYEAVDWKLVYAIGTLESGNYRSSLAQANHNYFGRKDRSGGYASWSNPSEAIEDQFAYVNRRYIAIGLDTPEKMNPVYAESPTWAFKVNHIMNSL